MGCIAAVKAGLVVAFAVSCAVSYLPTVVASTGTGGVVAIVWSCTEAASSSAASASVSSASRSSSSVSSSSLLPEYRAASVVEAVVDWTDLARSISFPFSISLISCMGGRVFDDVYPVRI